MEYTTNIDNLEVRNLIIDIEKSLLMIHLNGNWFYIHYICNLLQH